MPLQMQRTRPKGILLKKKKRMNSMIVKTIMDQNNMMHVAGDRQQATDTRLTRSHARTEAMQKPEDCHMFGNLMNS